jgi:hypothetical protein
MKYKNQWNPNPLVWQANVQLFRGCRMAGSDKRSTQVKFGYKGLALGQRDDHNQARSSTSSSSTEKLTEVQVD